MSWAEPRMPPRRLYFEPDDQPPNAMPYTFRDDNARKYIDFAVDGAARMSQLISDLLAYSRIGYAGPDLQPVDASKALSSASANLQELIRESSAVITHENLPVIPGNLTQLSQLFQNLLGNAIKFRREGLPPQIHVGCRRGNGHWLFSVQDNGIGIAPEFHDKVFKIFKRLHGRGKYPGTGIGLAICRKIIEQHGGRIWIESKPNEGSTFYFALPGLKKADSG